MDKAEEARDVRRNNWLKAATEERGSRKFPLARGASDLEPNLINPLIDGDVAMLKSSINKGLYRPFQLSLEIFHLPPLPTNFMRWRVALWMNYLERLEWPQTIYSNRESVSWAFTFVGKSPGF